MRQSKEEAARTRARIVKTASRAYRRRGLDGVGLAEVMAEAGLTHGGFYKHFPSKDALAAEAVAFALEETRGTLEAAIAAAPAGGGLAALVETYLTPAHRDRPERGCALAALGTAAAHGAPAIRAELAKGYRRLADLAAAQMGGGDAEARQARGQALASAMVGALMLARAEPDPARADALLAENRAALMTAFGGGTPAAC